MTQQKTLAQAIEDVIAAAWPPFTGLPEAVEVLSKARGRLDGLEESRAVIDTRARAYEHAISLTMTASGSNSKWTATPDRILEVARFLAPVWEELEGEEDPLGPNASVAELEASEAEAVARADALVDEVARLERYLVQAQDQNRLLTQKVEHRDALIASTTTGLNAEMDLVMFNGQPWAMRKELAVEWRRMADDLGTVEARAL